MNESEQNKKLRAQLAVLTTLVADLPAPALPFSDDRMFPWLLVASAVDDARCLLNDIALERAS